MKISELAPNPQNPRQITDKKLKMLKKALEKFGDLSGFVYNRRSKQLVGGHQRAKIFDSSSEIIIHKTYDPPTKTGTVAEGAVLLNGEEFKYREVDWSDSQEKAANIAANKGAGEWDKDLLSEWVNHLAQDITFDLDLTMFDELEREEFLQEPEKIGLIEDDAMPEYVEPRAKLGDLYRLGNHRLLCGDATLINDVEKLTNGVLMDLVITDPPYNVAVNDESAESLAARNRRSDGLKISNDKMSEEDFREFLLSIFTNYFIVMREGASIYVFYADSMTIPFMSTFVEAGFHFAQNCIWNKQQFVMTRKDYHYKHEPVLYGWKLGTAHGWFSDRKQSSVWNFDRPFKSELHPTMKPIELLTYPMDNSSDHNANVLDLFGGSGSTLIACEKTNRKCFMMELDPHYCDVIVTRWENFTGKKAELIESAINQETTQVDEYA